MHTAFLEQEITRSLSPSLCPQLQDPLLSPPAPQPRELLTIEEESERLARELREVCLYVQVKEYVTPHSELNSFLISVCSLLFQVSRNRDSIRAQLNQLCQYRGVLTQMHFLTASQVRVTFHIPFLAFERDYFRENYSYASLSYASYFSNQNFI